MVIIIMSRLYVGALYMLGTSKDFFLPYQEEHKRQILSAFKTDGMTDNSIRYLHSLIMSLPILDQFDTLIDIDFLLTMARWISVNVNADRLVSLGGLNAHTLLLIAQLVYVILSGIADRKVTGVMTTWEQFLAVPQRILAIIQPFIMRCNNAYFRGAYIQCTAIILAIKPETVNIHNYAQLLATNDKVINQFYHFMNYYLLQLDTEEQNREITKLILKGFNYRMNIFRIGKSLFKGQDRLTNSQFVGIGKAYRTIINYLRKNINLPRFILKYNPEIFENLHAIARLSIEQSDRFSQIFHSIISLYMCSWVEGKLHFSFILETAKNLIAWSPHVFTNIQKSVWKNHFFIEWYILKEVKQRCRQEILENYLKNSASLEFLMLMINNFLCFFQQEKHTIASHIRSLGLLEEAKCFIHLPSIKQCFQIYFKIIGDYEFFLEFLQRVQRMPSSIE